MIIGLVAGLLIGIVTAFYTGTGTRKPMGQRRQSMSTGSATKYTAGLGVDRNVHSDSDFDIACSRALLERIASAGLYGIAIAAVGMRLMHRYPSGSRCLRSYLIMRVVSRNGRIAKRCQTKTDRIGCCRKYHSGDRKRIRHRIEQHLRLWHFCGIYDRISRDQYQCSQSNGDGRFIDRSDASILFSSQQWMQ